MQELKVENVSTSECYYEHGYIETLTSFTTGKFIMTKDAVFHDKQEEILQVFNQNEKVINVGEQYEVHHYGKDGVCTKPGCNAYNDTIHVHKWNEGKITTNPTCEYNGEKEYTCIECNTIRVEILSKLGHDLIHHEKLGPTCTTKGHTEYDTCSRCDYTTFKELPSLGHKSSDWIIDKDSTCILDGSKHKECTVCHETLETEVINKLGHDLEHHDKLDPTCTTKGHTEYDTCSRCDYTTFKELPSTGHKESDWIIDVEPTCLDKGSKHTECTICHKLLEEVEIEALGHNYVSGKCTRCEDSIFIIENGNQYIYFGEYPQSIKDDNVTIISNIPDSDGYYLGSDNERYAKVTAKPYSSPYYFSNKQQIVKGTTYYFKVEPIKWKILQVNGTQYKLVTDLIIDNQVFNASTGTRTIDGKIIYPNNYEYSDIRNWLNKDFYNNAFTKVLQLCINTTLVDNSLASTGDSSNKYICNNTYDKVYLLSYKDITNTEYGFIDNASRQKQLTDYAKAQGCCMNKDDSYYNNGYYWFRSPDHLNDYYARCVSDDGHLYSYWFIRDSVGVSAAITISLS